MKRPMWQVWIADLEASRRIPAKERPAVDRALSRAIDATAKRYPGAFRLGPELLRGDELQAVLRPDAPALAMLTYLRARIAATVGRQPALQTGIGRGSISRLSTKGPFASEGEAFHRARAALESVRSGRGGLTAWIIGDPTFDSTAAVVLGLADGYFRRWTQPQWSSIAGRLEDRGLNDIARRDRVRFQSVSKRLIAASWSEVQHAIEFLERRAAANGRRASHPPGVELRNSTSRG